MTREEHDRSSPLAAFLLQLERDTASGGVRPLASYLQRFPGDDVSIAMEYLARVGAMQTSVLANAEEPRWVSDGGSHGEPLAAGLALGPYRLLREIGRGGQGVVFEAEDRRLGRRVALKVLTGFAGPSTLRARFRQEAHVASRLDHPGICTVLDTDLEGNPPWIAMRLLEGESLAALIAAGRSAAPVALAPAADPSGTDSERQRTASATGRLEALLRFFEGAARALHAAHEAGILHRDIKPGNIMVTPRGDAVIMDFGLARDDVSESATLTRTGDIFGTPAYMSPEQLSAGAAQLDRRTDVWSLGVSLYEALAGVRPFAGASREQLYQSILAREPEPVGRRLPALPKDLSVVVATALSKERDRRYQTAADLAEDLRRVREREPILARPAGPFLRLKRWAERSPALAVSLALLLLSLVSGLAASTKLLRDSRRSDEEARDALSSFLRLADERRVEDLVAAAGAALWPPGEETIPGIENWLAEAQALLARLPEHEAALDALADHPSRLPARDDAARRREVEDRIADLQELVRYYGESRGELARIRQGVEDTEHLSGAEESVAAGRIARIDAIDRNLVERIEMAEEGVEILRAAGHPGGEREFADQDVKWRYDRLRSLVQSMRLLQGAGGSEMDIRRREGSSRPGDNQLREDLVHARTAPPPPDHPAAATVPGMQARLLLSRRIAAEEAGGSRGLWAEAADRVAASPRYPGLRLPVLPGLIPLGPDPASGLEEFADLHTGAVPVRSESGGRLAMAEDSAVVFVLIPGGTAVLGAQAGREGEPGFDPGAQGDEAPVTEIELAPFLLAKTEVTQRQWWHLMGTNPSYVQPGSTRFGVPSTWANPVESISWSDAAAAAARMRATLPTEAQWEHAARAGSTGSWWCPPALLPSAGNLADRSVLRYRIGGGEPIEDWDDGWASTAPVATFLPNPFGLFDVIGNVSEFCLDYYGDYIASFEEGTGRRRTLVPRMRAVRGGSLQDLAGDARTASRSAVFESFTSQTIGFRPARNLPPGEAIESSARRASPELVPK